jgi:Protein of unknown function (DUF2971)
MADITQTHAPTEEQINVLIGLQKIFMPHAYKQRDDCYKKQTGVGGETSRQPIRFAHYTSADAALNIIRSKRFWMRNTTCMADYREVLHGFEILQRFFRNDNKRGQFVAALDACIPNIARDALNRFEPWSLAGSPTSIQLNTYIASMSEHDMNEDSHGRLSMWRSFKTNVARVAIVFKVPWHTGAADALNIIFSPVAYLDETQVNSVLEAVINNVRINSEFLKTVDRELIIGFVFNMLLTGMTCLKHEGFQEEHEWRAVYTPKIRQSPLMEYGTEVIDGVPQTVHKLPLDGTISPVLAELDIARFFDRLIIGPTAYPWIMYEAFVEALLKAKVPDPSDRVVVSGIPIRS